MFTKRQTVILRMLLSYGLSNLDEINLAFATSDMQHSEEMVNYNDEIIPAPTEKDIEELMKLLQG
jgi:hypothetical protein